MEELFNRKIYQLDVIETNVVEKLDYFYDYRFYEAGHSYYYKSEKVNKSVTGLVSQFVEPFDEKKWLPKKAKERGISELELKAEWQKKADISASTGTLFHRYMEEGLAGKLYCPETSKVRPDILLDVMGRYDKLVPLANEFIRFSRAHFIPFKSEFIVGLRSIIAGQIDQIFYNKESKKFDIYDWKTNKEISCWSVWHKKMLGPFQSLDECELNSYSLQLSIYKWLLEKQGFKIDKLNLVWFNENNKSFMIMPCKDLSNQVESIIMQ